MQNNLIITKLNKINKTNNKNKQLEMRGHAQQREQSTFFKFWFACLVDEPIFVPTASQKD